MAANQYSLKIIFWCILPFFVTTYGGERCSALVLNLFYYCCKSFSDCATLHDEQKACRKYMHIKCACMRCIIEIALSAQTSINHACSYCRTIWVWKTIPAIIVHSVPRKDMHKLYRMMKRNYWYHSARVSGIWEAQMFEPLALYYISIIFCLQLILCISCVCLMYYVCRCIRCMAYYSSLWSHSYVWNSCGAYFLNPHSKMGK